MSVCAIYAKPVADTNAFNCYNFWEYEYEASPSPSTKTNDYARLDLGKLINPREYTCFLMVLCPYTCT